MIILLDGNSIAYRAYHKAPRLNAPDGTPTGAVHVFFTIIEKVRSQLKPEKIIAVFDSYGTTHRHEIYPEYKANREAMPEDLASQISLARHLLSLAGVDVYAKSGIEADDIIATIAKESEDNVVIVTKDKDLFQLIDDKVKIYDDQTGKLLGAEETKTKYGVTPDEMLAYLALMGDKSDNIPGISGVGEKTAAKLIDQYKTLDNLYANIDEQKGKLKENLLRDKDNAYKAYELIALETIKPLFPPENAKNTEKLANELFSLGMRTVATKLLGDGAYAVAESEMNYALCAMGKVEKPSFFIAVDDILYVTDGKYYEHYDYDKHPFGNADKFYDVKAFRKKSGKEFKSVRDYLLISWLTEPDNGTIRKSKAESMEEFIPRLLGVSSAFDKRLADLGLEKLYSELELPIANILADMEKNGIAVDPKRVRIASELLNKELDIVSRRLVDKAGYEINLNSPKQLADYLYDVLKIPHGKGKRSTSEDIIKELATSFPEYKDVLDDILLYREYAKLLSTYTKPLTEAIAADGRIHTSFKQTGTATGRLSSVSPNLQNIPTRGEMSKSIRGAFVPESGNKFLSLDYSQIELRVLAHMSHDAHLNESFLAGEDIHSATAMKIFGIKKAEVTHDARRIAKAVNFGIIYGLSPYGLSRDAGITAKEAKTFIDTYFKLHSGVKEFIAKIIEETRLHGFCSTLLGRKRFFPDINSRNGLNRQRAERAAINAPIQGSVADIIKLAMIKCSNMPLMQEYKAKMLLQIHDELIFELPADKAEAFAAAAKVQMESVLKLSVPLVVNQSIGNSWVELK